MLKDLPLFLMEVVCTCKCTTLSLVTHLFYLCLVFYAL